MILKSKDLEGILNSFSLSFYVMQHYACLLKASRGNLELHLNELH